MNKKWMNRGRAFLEFTPAPVTRACNRIVRIYYRSEGGEVLCVESAPLTWQAAYALECEMRQCAVKVELRRVSEERELADGARLVILPSQVARESQTEIPLAA